MAARILSAADAAELVQSRDTLGVPLGPGQPGAFLHALGGREEFTELTVFGALLRGPLRGVHPARSPLPVGVLRAGRALPARQRRGDRVHPGRLPSLLADRRAAVTRASWPRPRRRPTRTATPRCRCTAVRPSTRSIAPAPTRTGILVVETNAKFPRTYGSDLHPHRVHVDEIDVIVESDRDPFVLADVEATDADRAIAGHVATLVPDGATLQTGIGGIPSTVVGLLARRRRRRLRHPLRDVHDRSHAAAPRRQGDEHAGRASTTACRSRPSPPAPRSSTPGCTRTTRSRSSPSTW